MTSESATTGETSTRTHRANGSDTSADGRGLATAVHEVRGALEGMGRSVPDAARLSRAAATDLFRAIEKGFAKLERFVVRGKLNDDLVARLRARWGDVLTIER